MASGARLFQLESGLFRALDAALLRDDQLAHVIAQRRDVATPPLRRQSPEHDGLEAPTCFSRLADGLGSTNIVIDKETSELVEYASYHAYGATDSDHRPGRWGAFREDMPFTGKEEDIETGLHYFGARRSVLQPGIREQTMLPGSVTP